MDRSGFSKGVYALVVGSVSLSVDLTFGHLSSRILRFYCYMKRPLSSPHAVGMSARGDVAAVWIGVLANVKRDSLGYVCVSCVHTTRSPGSFGPTLV